LLPANRIDDLVLEDSGEPGPQARSAGEARSGKRGQQRLLHGVLGERLVAQLKARDAQQVAAVHVEIAGVIGGGHDGLVANRSPLGTFYIDEFKKYVSRCPFSHAT
jgi:hypothetical protein